MLLRIVILETMLVSGVVKGVACRAQHDQSFSNFGFFHFNWEINICVYVNRIHDLILTKTSTLHLILCSAFDVLC